VTLQDNILQSSS